MSGAKRRASEDSAEPFAPESSSRNSSPTLATTIGSEEPPFKKRSLPGLDGSLISRASIESVADGSQREASQSAVVKTVSQASSVCGHEDKEQGSLGEAPSSLGANVADRYLGIYEYFLQANPEGKPASFEVHGHFHIFYDIELGVLNYTPGAGQTDSAWKSTEESRWCPSEEVKKQFIQDWDYFRPLGPKGESRRGTFPTGWDNSFMLAQVIVQPLISMPPPRTLVIEFIRGRKEEEKLQDLKNANSITELSNDED